MSRLPKDPASIMGCLLLCSRGLRGKTWTEARGQPHTRLSPSLRFSPTPTPSPPHKHSVLSGVLTAFTWPCSFRDPEAPSDLVPGRCPYEETRRHH